MNLFHYFCNTFIASMEYKRLYSPEDIRGLRKWYEAHLEEMPESFRMSDFNYIEDMKETARTIILILKNEKMEVAFSGHIHQFFVLRDKLEAYMKEHQSER